VEVPEDDEDDLIAMPEINPLDISYHDIGGFEDQLKENKELSFKKCFEA
jgi:ATP-dependent 26S proteasome regulatory subunit